MGSFAFPSLTPTYALGSYGRTAGAILIGNTHATIAGQNRIYAWYKRRGLGEEYKNYLLTGLGPPRPTRANWPSLALPQ
jgi:hypothetical protein